MSRSSEQRVQEAPLYVRWPPENSLLAIELRLDLVSQLADQLAGAAQQNIEIGGVLLGSLPSAPSATLRVDEIELIDRHPEEGAVFLLHPKQVGQFQQICRSAKARGYSPVGLFRTHLRPGPLQPAIADRTLLSEQFGRAPHALLLVRGRPEYQSTFFVAVNGQIAPQPAVAEFRFEESAFKALPEVPLEQSAAPTKPLRRPPPSRSRLIWLLCLAVLVAASFAWLLVREPVTARSSAPSNQIGLAMSPEAGVLHISWNHSSRAVSRARSATLQIDDGSRHVQLALGADDLRLGSIEYQNTSPQVVASMTLDVPGVTLPAQSARWHSR